MEEGAVSLAGVSALVLAAAALMGSPGPSTMSLTAVAAAFGIRKSLAYAAGLILGTVGVLVVVATGATTLLLSVPGLAPVLVAASTAYIVWLAVRIARAPPLGPAQDDGTAPSFGAAVALGLANPKAYAAIGAVFAGGRVVAGAPMLDGVLKTLILTLMVVLIHLAWLVAGAALAGVLRRPRTARIVNVGLAVLLVATSALALLR